MRTARSAPIAVAVVLSIALSIALSTSAAAATWLVPGDSSTITAAIRAASDGDTIVVAPGTYVESVDFGGKTIELRSSDGPAVTTLDGAGLAQPVVTVSPGSQSGTRLEGFTIRNSSGGAAGVSILDDVTIEVVDCIIRDNVGHDGGGARVSGVGASARFDGCTFEDNTSTDSGGGLNVRNEADVAVSECQFIGNVADGFLGGGGMAVSIFATLDVTNSTFDGNNAYTGGGLSASSLATATATDCTFIGNISDMSAGGGVLVRSDGTTVAVIRCTFEDNVSSTSGGGILVNAATLDATDCTFRSNVAALSGAGLNVNNESTATITGCHFIDNFGPNDGGGVAIAGFDVESTFQTCWFEGNTAFGSGAALSVNGLGKSMTTLDTCTVVGNETTTGGGIYISSPATTHAIDCVIVDNQASTGGGVHVAASGNAEISGSTVDANTVLGGSGAGGGIHVAAGGLLTLGTSSVCNNAPDDIVGDFTDAGGNTACAPDCRADLDVSGDVGFSDLTQVLQHWGACSPECPWDIDASGDVGFGDLTSLLAAWGPCPTK